MSELAAWAQSPLASDEVKSLVLAHRDALLADPDLLKALGLAPAVGANVLHFGPAALSRASAAHQRESSQRRHLEAVARANFEAQARTHAAVIEILEADSLADLALRLDALAREQFGLCAAVLAVEGPSPRDWRMLAPGQADLLLGEGAPVRMGPLPTALGLFRDRGVEVASVALIRLGLWRASRIGVLAFASSDADAFAEDMGADLISFVARVSERCAERWPSPG